MRQTRLVIHVCMLLLITLFKGNLFHYYIPKKIEENKSVLSGILISIICRFI